jgi:hypothetical protein
MKKNILLVKSLLLLPLVTPVSAFSMMPEKFRTDLLTPAERKEKREQKKLSNSSDNVNRQNIETAIAEDIMSGILSQFPTAITISDVALNVTTDQLPTEATVSNEEVQNVYDLITNVDRDAMDKADVKGELFSAVHYELRNNTTPLKSRKIIKPNVPARHQDVLKNVLNDLVTNPTTLKTPKTIEVSQAAPIDCWVEKHQAFQNVLHQLVKSEVTLKTPKAIETSQAAPIDYWIEKHQAFQNVLHQLVKNKVALKTPKLNASDLEQSVVVAEIPTEKGLSGWMYRHSLARRGKENIIYDALVDGSFNQKNEDHRKMLDYALNFYVDNNNRERLMSMLEICQYLAGEFELNEITARKVHNFLENITTETEAASKLTLENKGQQFETQRNALLAAYQEEIANRTKALHAELTRYEKDCDDTFTIEADLIRTLKTGTIILHTINPRLLLKKSEPCSDKIQCLSSKYNKVYMTQADVDSVYSNERLLRAIEVDKSMATIKNNTHDLLAKITAINQTAQEIEVKQHRPMLPMPGTDVKQITL